MTQIVNIQILIALALVCSACQRSSDHHDSTVRKKSQTEIDTTIVCIVDYTGDSVPDTARLRITAKAFTKPFSWDFDVISQEGIVFHREGVDTWMDSLFADTGFVSGCSGYDNCKRKYYIEELGLYVLKPRDYDGVSLAEAMTDSVHYGSVFNHDLIDSCGISPDEAKVMADSVAFVLKSAKCLLVSFIDSPVESGPVLVYVDRLKRFVPIYDD